MNDGTERKHRHGFDDLPDELVADNLTVRCLIPENAPEFCDGWETSVEIAPTDIRMDGYGRLHFPEHVPTECPECGDRVLEYNGVEVNFHV